MLWTVAAADGAGRASLISCAAVRGPYQYGQLICAAIVLFNVLVHGLAAVRVREERARELNLACAFLFLGLHALAFARIMAGDAAPYWHRAAGALHYSLWLFFVRIIDTYEAKRSPLSRVLHLGALGGVVVNLFTDLPVVYRPAGDLDLLLIGVVKGARMPLATALVDVLFSTLAAAHCLAGSIVAVRRGHAELRAIPPLFAIGFPLFCVGFAIYVGWVPLPPPTGFLAAIVALFMAWHTMERQARLARQALASAQRAPADRIGDYRLLRRLGSGGMAEVYLAEKLAPGQNGESPRLAVKRILSHLTEDPRYVQMFLDEARLAARLSHPNIVRVHELGKDGPTYFLAMEYVPGASLCWLLESFNLRGERFAPSLAAQVGLQVLEGLSYAHTLTDDHGQWLRLVHRDVSPQNILVGDNGVVKLLDFGIAFHTEKQNRTETGMLKGKIAYSAPEYIAGEALDRRADLFSLGVVLYQMVVGDRPFDGPTDGATLNNILHGHFVAPSRRVPDLPERLERVIVRALCRDPARRFQSADEMAATLRFYLADAGSRADGQALARLVSAELSRAAAEGRSPGADGCPPSRLTVGAKPGTRSV